MFASPSQSMAKKTKVKLNKKKVTLYVGKSVRLKVKGTKKKAKWKSSSKKVATVSSKGTVKAKKKGKAKITAKVGKKKLVCRVTVKNKKKTTSTVVNNGGQPGGGNGDGSSAATQPPANGGNGGETNVPQPPVVGDKTPVPATEIPQPTDDGTETAVPSTDKPKPTDAGTETAAPATDKPKPTDAGTETAVPATTKPTPGIVATERPQPTQGVVITAAPATEKPQPAESQAPVIIPTTVKDASFEEGTDGFTARGNASISVVENGYGEGNCLQVSNRTAATDGVVYSAGEEVEAGESYTIQGYVKAASGTIKCMYRTGDSDADVHELASVSVSGEWVKFMGTLTVPEGFSKLDIWFELDDAGETFFLDEVKILKIVNIKEVFDPIFGKTGTCINPNQLEDPDILAYVKKNYSSLSLENDMKPDSVLQTWSRSLISTETAKGKTGDYVIPDSYKESQVPELNYRTIDKVMKIAKENGLKIRYHVLVWHAQTPEWFFKEGYSTDENAKYVSQETMYARMEMYIRSVIHHVYTLDGGAYRDVVYTWDVVNEYFANNPDKNWSAVFGNRVDADHPGFGNTRPEFVKRAFEIAYDELEKLELEQFIPLMYNDFNTYQRTNEIIELINFINSGSKKVCAGVGMQSHVSSRGNFSSVDNYISTLQSFLEEGFQVQITELDVASWDTEEVEENGTKVTYLKDENGDRLPSPLPHEEKMAGYEVQAQYVSDLTKRLINLQRDYHYQINGLTWWGMHDGVSWVKSHALMFQGEQEQLAKPPFEAKPSYYAFMQAAESELSKPAPTPPPLRKYDFEEDPYKSETSQATHVVNDDGSMTLTFNGGGAYDFFLPQNEWGGVDYKSVVITYTSEGGDLSHSLFDANAAGMSNVQAGKHTDWGNKIKNTQGAEKKLIFSVGDDFAGGCIRGIQLFTQNTAANVTITIKSMLFCGKKNPTKYDLDPTLNPPQRPTLPTPVPTEKPVVTAEPTAVPTPPSQVKFDFSNEDSYHIEEPSKASHVLNADGSITITFQGGGAYDFFLPERYWNGIAYKSIELTYTSEGGNLGHALYDGDTVGSSDINKGKHPDWSQKIKATDGVEKKLVFNVTDECVGGCIRGLQIFTQNAETTITIKSMVFRDVVSLDVSNLSGGEKTDNGVVLNDIEQVTIPLPKLDDLTKGTKVEVTVSGTLLENSDGFRMWLAEGTTTASDHYHYTKNNGVGLGGKPGDGDSTYQAGAFTVTGQLTVGNNSEPVKLDTANNLLIKAPVYQGKLNGITITDICVRSLGNTTHRWVTTWGTAEEKCSIKENDDRMPNLPLEDTTVRQIIRVTTGGEKLRLRLSNQYGESDVTVKSLHLAKQVKADASTIDTATDQVVTVNGTEEFVIPKGKVIVTDPVDFSVNALENIAITSYFGASPTKNITGHRGARATTYQVSGNHVSDETLTEPKTTLSWFFLADASIWSTKESKAVVCFGDSITDGYGTDADYLGKKPDSYTRWVDYFAKRLQENDKTKHISVINEGIGSNSILGAYPTDAGKDRFARDLLEHDGVGYCNLTE
jgi:endo-1,4-beta-xylanase